MQVLALGLCRTGTESMRRALMQLDCGFVYHANATMERPQDHRVWEDLAERKFGPRKASISREHFDRVIGDCGAVTDCPCVAFWEELMDAYPEAKVVLVERDVEAWYRSFEAVVINEVLSWKGSFLIWATNMGLVDASPLRTNKKILHGVFRARNRGELANKARLLYTEHYAMIVAKAQRDGRALLTMKLEDGWPPLCAFLGKPVPEVDFPRGNEQTCTAQMVREYHNRMLLRLCTRVIKTVLVLGATLGIMFALPMVFNKRRS